jgi:radical SAM superfamily enzyme YgiQ (UPF0313 family)
MDNLIPTGLSLLSACLKKAGHDTKLFDTTFYKTVERTGDDARIETLQVKSTNLQEYGLKEKKTDMSEDFKNMIDEYKPDLIGLSIVETTQEIGLKLLNSIKDLDIPKIVGGIQVTMAPEYIISQDCVDMICVGEGEGAFVELANCLDKNEDYSHIKNLWIKKNGEIIKNPKRPLIDMNTLPMQDWTIYEKERLYKAFGGKHWVSGPIELNRGCVHRCAYCCNAKLQDMHKGDRFYARQRNLDKFFEELKFRVEKYGLQYPYLIAENFMQGGYARFEEFCERYKEFKLPFWAQMRVETINDDVAEKLREIGCERLSMGVEHGNYEFRKKVLNRDIPNEVIIKAFEAAKKAGLLCFANNIVGFPDETRELYFDTVELNRKIGVKSIINVFCAYRGTHLRNVAVEKGYMDKDAVAGDYRRDVKLNMPHLTAKQVEGLQRTFLLYVNLPKEYWPEIEKAEKFDEEGNTIFKKLADLYFEKYEPKVNKK